MPDTSGTRGRAFMRWSRACVIPLIIAFAVVGPRPVAAQPEWRLSGYAKNLGITSRSIFSDERFVLDVTRLRLQTSVVKGSFHVEAWMDTELLAGSYFDTPEAALGASITDASADRVPFVDLDWHVADGSRWTLDQRIFRATATWYGRGATVTVGRQRVAWGTGFVWTPTDVLHPQQPTAIERDEKGAVDAVLAVVPLGTMSAVEAVVAPGRRSGSHRFAGRLRGHVGEYDYTLMGGRFADRWIFGGDFAGYVGNAGLRGEAAWTRGPDGAWTLRAVANGDYTFADGFYGLLEVHFNGPGASSTSEYDPAALYAGDLLNLGRWYTAAAVSWQATPLMAISGYVVHNLGDGSSLLGPGITRSMTQNLEMGLGIYIFRGGSETEFGSYHDAAFLTLQYFF